ncbi:FUSC family protein [Pseudoxanthomonas suwonensis]|uniref:FUSC family protein n=1 Tax=Pseudoxanthomonas suwonensis TaxID=314722 RepID=UPI0004BABC75|nr:FUSC family protein [Pseudoxanthomonas suwonensis]
MSLPPPPAPPPRPSVRQMLREMRQVRPLPPQRWAFAVRAGLAMGVPILAGWLAGDPAAGMMATIGGFTSLYGSGRPYGARALMLAVVAGVFATAVAFGLWLEHLPWLVVVPVLSLLAMLAAWLCNATRTGPPGAYLFVLACAAGTAIPADHLSPLQAGALVSGGGAFAWLLHMAGMLWQPRGPERKAVATAAAAVARWVGHAGEAGARLARRQAALALHDSWQMLVGFQPVPARAHGELARLRALNHELHLLFASTLATAPPPEHRAALQARASRLAEEARQPPILRPPSLPADAVPHGYPRSWVRLREGLAPGSNALRMVLRIGIATLLAGIVAGALDLERAYWAIAAALLMLYQGFDWPRTVLRSLERTLGTWLGLLLAGAVLWIHPTGPWLALMVMVLQFTIEITVVRNYAIAVVFITGVALTIASGGQPVDDIGAMLLARGVDTVLGCACALLAFRLLPPRADHRTLANGIGQCLLALREVCRHLAAGDATTVAARAARRDLQHRIFVLEQAVDEALAGSEADRRTATAWWPAVATCQRLAYRVLAACWDTERHPVAAPLPATDTGHADEALGTLARAWLQLRPPAPLPSVPPLLAQELGDLHGFLQRQLRPGDAAAASSGN